MKKSLTRTGHEKNAKPLGGDRNISIVGWKKEKMSGFH
jgi:hypothetical protein